ncbi:MAG: UbiA family prenyltransferase [Candidatus Dormibacter sp.]
MVAAAHTLPNPRQLIDGMMRRTAHRPIPSGRMRPVDALVFGLVLDAAAALVL